MVYGSRGIESPSQWGKGRSGKLTDHIFHSHTGRRKRDEAGSKVRSLTFPQSHPQWCASFGKSPPLNVPITSLHSIINWGPSIQILQPVEHTFNPTHHMLFAVGEMLKHYKFDLCFLSLSFSFSTIGWKSKVFSLPTSRNKKQINFCSSITISVVLC